MGRNKYRRSPHPNISRHTYGARSDRDLLRICETVDFFIREHVPSPGAGDRCEHAADLEISAYANALGLTRQGVMALWRAWKRDGSLRGFWATGQRRVSKSEALDGIA